MANDMKSGIGYLIPASGVVGFVIALLLGEFLASILITVLGILVWFLYMLVMESTIPKQMGNMIMLFGVMLSVGIFLGFGITQNLWGGFEFKSEGSLLSLVILFFSVLTGLNFRNQQSILRSSGSSSTSLSDDDRKFVLSAIDKAQSSKKLTENSDPRVIVVKQEAPSVSEEPVKKEELNPYDPYLMANNPYFSYPPEYYDEYEDDEWDEDEDEYEYEDEYED
tara:strand:+ start:929 stop:1597 length:669 start_codon:yes stop_codon:yes gene_type:complete